MAARPARHRGRRAGERCEWVECCRPGDVARRWRGDLRCRLWRNVRPAAPQHSPAASAARRLDDHRRLWESAVSSGARSGAPRALHRRGLRRGRAASPAPLASARRAERRRGARRRRRSGPGGAPALGARAREVAMFIDRVTVNVKAGDGGSGIISFRREKFVPMGGPDGGDGGRGGDVEVVGDSNLATLLDYTYRDSWTAEKGDHGSGANKSGRSGASVALPVPVGTIIRDLTTSELLGEVLEHGQRIVLARGGRGGKGNAHFATATHQSPREYQPGEDGEARALELELKLIADVGLVGQPNAGKSTLLSVVSAARPKIADYPFTTLSPNLGVVQLSDGRTFVVADIPG